jgi:hypothetical protein
MTEDILMIRKIVPLLLAGVPLMIMVDMWRMTA